MSPDPLVSLIVPSHGGAARLPALLSSLAAQEVDDPWEVIVVLDGVFDDSPALLASWRDRLPLRVITLPANLGVAGALNQGYAAALGDIAIRCDDDLSLPPDFIEGHLRRHLDRAADAPPLGVISPTRDEFADTPYARAYGRPSNDRLRASTYAQVADQTWRHWAACNSVPLAAFRAVGGFDEQMRYREDSELGLRLAQSGVEIVVAPDLEVGHRGPAQSVRERAGRAWTSGSSMNDFEARHPEITQHRPTPAGMWGRAVLVCAALMRTPHAVRRAGSVVDVLIGVLPAPLSSRLIALVVEAAGWAGGRSSTTTEWDRRPTAIE